MANHVSLLENSLLCLQYGLYKQVSSWLSVCQLTAYASLIGVRCSFCRPQLGM